MLRICNLLSAILVYGLLAWSSSPFAQAQDRIIRGSVYNANSSTPPIVSVQIDGRKQFFPTGKIEVQLSASQGFPEEIMIIPLVGFYPIRVINLPTRQQQVRLGALELIPYSSESISEQDYKALKIKLTDSLRSAFKADSILKLKYSEVITVSTAESMRPEYLRSLSDQEKKKYIEAKKNTRSSAIKSYRPKEPAKEKIAVQLDDRILQIPVRLDISKTVILLDYRLLMQ